MDHKLSHLEEFELIPRRELGKISFPLARLIRNIYNIPFYSIPIRFKDKKSRPETIDMNVLGNAIGFNTLEMTNLFLYHDDRYKQYGKQYMITYCIFIIIYFLCCMFATSLYFDKYNLLLGLSESRLLKTLHDMLALSVLFLFTVVIGGLCLKTSALFSASKYVDTLCIRTIIGIVIQLSYDDVLSHSILRKELINRLNTLARNTMLLSRHYYSHYDPNRIWAQKHFKHMELYIRERERWVLAPTGTTLATLRHDFYELIEIYLFGNYGNFIWQADIPLPENRPLMWSEFLASTGIHVLVAVLPLMAMGYLLWESRWVTSVGLQSVITLIFIGWFLIIIDAFLKIGIVDKLVNLGKGIKELKN